MIDIINKIINDLKDNFPDLCDQEDAIQFEMLKDLEKLKTEAYDAHDSLRFLRFVSKELKSFKSSDLYGYTISMLNETNIDYSDWNDIDLYIYYTEKLEPLNF